MKNLARILFFGFWLMAFPAWGASPVMIPPDPVARTCITGAYISWETDTVSTSRVDYGTTTAYGLNVTDAGSVVSHNLTISNLSANTIYHYKVTSGATVSGDYTFTTLAEPSGTVKAVKTSGGDYTSLATCMNAASDGRTCVVYSGVTLGTVTIAKDGASTASYNTALAHDPVSATKFDLTGHKYIAIKGFEITGGSPCVTVTSGSYITIDDNYIHECGAGSDGIYNNAATSDVDHVWVKNNTFYATSSKSGNGETIFLFGNYIVIENNWGSHGGEDFIELGSDLTTGYYFVVRNNIYHHRLNLDGVGTNHPDFVQLMGGEYLGYSLFEGNTELVCTSAGGSDCHMFMFRAIGKNVPELIFRYNYGYNLDSAIFSVGGADPQTMYSAIYNNTGAAWGSSDTGSCIGLYSPNSTGPIKNNICYSGPGNSQIYGYNTSGGNICYNAGTGGGCTYTTHDPGLINYPYNASIGTSSWAKDNGVALTTISSGCGSSILTMGDASYFQPGWNSDWAGIFADVLAIGTVTNTAIVSSINYSTNQVTFNGAVSCTNGDSVWLYSKSDGVRVLYGAGPDIGAYEYFSGSPSTPNTLGSGVTITGGSF